jgi:hypothetical protein
MIVAYQVSCSAHNFCFYFREEFATHIIALGQSRRPEPATTQKVFAENLNAGLDKSTDHSMMIEVAAHIPSNEWRPDIEKYITCTSDGMVRIWTSTGQPLKSTASLTGASAYVLATAPFSKYNVVAISSNDHKLRFFSFEPRLRLDLEYDCGDCHAMAVHCFAVHVKANDTADRTNLIAYLVWGDDRGRLHFVLEDALMEMRSPTSTATVHAAKVRKSNPKHFSKTLFQGWVTKIEFLTGALPATGAASENDAPMRVRRLADPCPRAGLGGCGVLVASSNDGLVVTLDAESWQVAPAPPRRPRTIAPAFLRLCALIPPAPVPASTLWHTLGGPPNAAPAIRTGMDFEPARHGRSRQAGAPCQAGPHTPDPAFPRPGRGRCCCASTATGSRSRRLRGASSTSAWRVGGWTGTSYCGTWPRAAGWAGCEGTRRRCCTPSTTSGRTTSSPSTSGTTSSCGT